ncbi:hypothetical protein P4O66_012068 [Electrophorus voltai]|uniref:CUB domain-containing protein n=1 Tax=Electrophorus voltai TaxID=2609070 RepID=A0AAD8Z6B3_9TELE|nr:hypothetical protein P4O66_012068 [Electrophorus voltai]
MNQNQDQQETQSRYVPHLGLHLPPIMRRPPPPILRTWEILAAACLKKHLPTVRGRAEREALMDALCEGGVNSSVTPRPCADLPHLYHSPSQVFFECGAKLDITDVHGLVLSPGFPYNYSSGTHCVWQFLIPTGHLLTLEMLDFDVFESHGDMDGSPTPAAGVSVEARGAGGDDLGPVAEGSHPRGPGRSGRAAKESGSVWGAELKRLVVQGEPSKTEMAKVSTSARRLSEMPLDHPLSRLDSSPLLGGMHQGSARPRVLRSSTGFGRDWAGLAVPPPANAPTEATEWDEDLSAETQLSGLDACPHDVLYISDLATFSSRFCGSTRPASGPLEFGSDAQMVEVILELITTTHWGRGFALLFYYRNWTQAAAQRTLAPSDGTVGALLAAMFGAALFTMVMGCTLHIIFRPKLCAKGSNSTSSINSEVNCSRTETDFTATVCRKQTTVPLCPEELEERPGVCELCPLWASCYGFYGDAGFCDALQVLDRWQVREQSALDAEGSELQLVAPSYPGQQVPTPENDRHLDLPHTVCVSLSSCPGSAVRTGCDVSQHAELECSSALTQLEMGLDEVFMMAPRTCTYRAAFVPHTQCEQFLRHSDTEPSHLQAAPDVSTVTEGIHIGSVSSAQSWAYRMFQDFLSPLPQMQKWWDSTHPFTKLVDRDTPPAETRLQLGSEHLSGSAVSAVKTRNDTRLKDLPFSALRDQVNGCQPESSASSAPYLPTQSVQPKQHLNSSGGLWRVRFTGPCCGLLSTASKPPGGATGNATKVCQQYPEPNSATSGQQEMLQGRVESGSCPAEDEHGSVPAPVSVEDDLQPLVLAEHRVQPSLENKQGYKSPMRSRALAGNHVRLNREPFGNFEKHVK